MIRIYHCVTKEDPKAAAHGPASPLDFIQAPHHGSRRNLAPSLLDDLLGPRLARSAESGSPEHHPQLVEAAGAATVLDHHGRRRWQETATIEQVIDADDAFELGVTHDVRGEAGAAGPYYLCAARAGHPGAMYGLAQLAYARGDLPGARLWYDLAVIADGLRQATGRGADRSVQVSALLRAVAEPTRPAVDALHRLSYYDANASAEMLASDQRLRAAADAGEPTAVQRMVDRLTARAALMTLQSWEDIYLHADLEAEIQALDHL